MTKEGEGEEVEEEKEKGNEEEVEGAKEKGEQDVLGMEEVEEAPQLPAKLTL